MLAEFPDFVYERTPEMPPKGKKANSTQAAPVAASAATVSTEEPQTKDPEAVAVDAESPVFKSPRPVRNAAKKKSQESASANGEDKDDEYEADEEEDLSEQKKKAARGKRAYDHDEDYGKAKKGKKARKLNEVPKKPGRAPSRGKGRKPALGRSYTSDDDEERTGAKKQDTDSDSDEEAKVVKRPVSVRMSGAPPSARMTALKKKHHEDSD